MFVLFPVVSSRLVFGIILLLYHRECTPRDSSKVRIVPITLATIDVFQDGKARKCFKTQVRNSNFRTKRICEKILVF